MNSFPFTTQYLFVTATLPVNIYNKLVEVFPDCEVIMGPGMNRTSPGLEELNFLANSFSFPAYSASDCSGDGTEETPDTAFMNKKKNKTALLQLVEERASRGIDFTGLDHVLLFDFPCDPSEYVHRVGRTARGAAGQGKAFIFVVGKQVSLARRIIERNMKGHPLHDAPAAYEQMRDLERKKEAMWDQSVHDEVFDLI